MLLAMVVSSNGFSEPLNLGEGLTVELSDTLPITFQTIPSYDANKKMLTRHAGETLQYFISINRLPRGFVDPEQYLSRLVRDLCAVSEGGTIDVIDGGNYTSAAGVAGYYIEYSFIPVGGNKTQHQVAHFLTNSRRSFAAIGALLDNPAADQLRDDAIAIFKTASISNSNMPTATTDTAVKADSTALK
jgi:hypothetical protein